MKTEEIENSPEFERWCIHPSSMVEPPEIWSDAGRRKAKLFCYYTKDGRLHLERITSEGDIIYHQTFQPCEDPSNAKSNNP